VARTILFLASNIRPLLLKPLKMIVTCVFRSVIILRKNNAYISNMIIDRQSVLLAVFQMIMFATSVYHIYDIIHGFRTS
jgi:hypothetical protein